MNKMIRLLSVTAVVALVGCNASYSTPSDVLAAAGQALKTNNLEAFQDSLQPFSEAKTQYGTAEGFKLLQSKLAGVESIAVENEELTSPAVLPTNAPGKETYSVDVIGLTGAKSSRVARSEVTCQVFYNYNGNSRTNDRKAFCRISKIEE